LLRDSGRWPALAELTVSTGEHRILDYLWEELLHDMPPQRRQLLARLALVGGADDEMAVALGRGPVSLTDQLTGLPLVAGVPGGWRSLHPLWGPALAGELSADERADTLVRAAKVKRERADLDGAFRDLAEARDWAAAREVICEAARDTHPLVAPDVLAEWHNLLPTEQRDEPECRLLLALVERSISLTSALTMFKAAAAEFQAVGNVSGEIAALTHVGHISWWLDDQATLTAGVARADALAASHARPDLGFRAILGRVWLADVRADWATAFDLLAGLPVHRLDDRTAAGVHWLRAWVLLLLGEPEQARSHADIVASRAFGTFKATGINVRLLSAWLSGAVDDAVRDVPVLAAATAAAGRALGVAFERSQCALLLAYAGELGGARHHLAQARLALAGASTAPMAHVTYALAEAAVLVAEGNEDEAREVLAAELAARPLGTGRSRMHRLFPALSYLLVPSSRAHWRSAPLPPALRRATELAAALAAARERGSLDQVAAVELAPAGQLRAILPLPWAVEFAAAAAAAGRGEGRDLVAALGGPARPRLRALAAAGGGRLARAARDLALAVPPAPAHHLELLALGPFELRRDGRPVEHPSLQRERVRRLLLFMVCQRAAPRQALAAELWPDLDQDAAARNLRVTLSYVQRVLEPDRLDGDPPFFLRSESGMLRLAVGEWLSVDVWEFERLLDDALRAERRGAPSLALRAYRQALPLYRGDYLVDLPDADWASVERDRLRVRYVTAATRAGELLLATGDHDAALAFGYSVLRVDRWAESAYRLLMAVYLADEEFDAARRILDRCERMLADLGTGLCRETRDVARRVRAGTRS
jgi:DNA-binding SARP family transcriptional activator